MNFLVNQFDGATAAGVPGGHSNIMLLTASFYVFCDPGVKGAIGAPPNIHEPFVAGRSIRLQLYRQFCPSEKRPQRFP
ncbi:MAG TPA: hypothetical protein VGZ25_14800, partial [Gemmataceae bacterium]|nr:hypothetical protein [Gemmataceae bacterium]